MGKEALFLAVLLRAANVEVVSGIHNVEYVRVVGS